MSVSRSPYFRSHATAPMSTVLIDDGGAKVEKITVLADEASIYPGFICYISATSYPNEVKMADAVHGDATTEARVGVIEIEASDVHKATNYDITTAGADLQAMNMIVLRPGIQFWAKGSSLSCAIDETLVLTNNGLLTNVAVAAGTAVDKSAHGFTALTALTSGTWIPVEYIGIIPIDNSA